MKALNKIIMLILALLCLPFVACQESESWQYEPGIIVTSGETTRTLSGQPGVLHTAAGDLRISSQNLERKSVYHLLILLKNEQLIYKGAESERDRTYAVTKLLWSSKNDGESFPFELRFDGSANTLTIGGQGFTLSGRNMFVVSVDQDWRASVKAMDGKVTDLLPAEDVLKRFQAISGDPAIQKLALSK